MRASDARRSSAALLACLATAACTPATQSSTASGPQAAHLEPVDDRSRVVLTERAVQRLGLRTAPVVTAEAGVDAVGTSVPYATVPYAAVLFDAEGATWAYASDGADTEGKGPSFLRQAITVDRFEGDVALLADGPPVGTRVVTNGAAELFGTELDVGH